MSLPHMDPSAGRLTPGTSFVLVSGTAASVEQFRETAASLQRSGHPVRWGYLAAASGEIPGVHNTHRLSAGRTPSRWRRTILRPAAVLAGPARRLALAVRYDVWFRRAVRRSDVVMALDEVADAALRAAVGFAPDVVTVGHALALRVLTEQMEWDRLDAALASPEPEDGLVPPPDPSQVEEVCSILRALVGGAGLGSVDPGRLHRLVDRLMGAQRDEDALRVIDLVKQVPMVGPTDPVLQAYEAVGELRAHGHTHHDPSELAGSVLVAADQALASDDLGTLTRLAALALTLVFHRELHSDVLRSRLVDDPVGYLGPCRASRTWTLLTAPIPWDRDEDLAKTRDAALRVTLLSGAYGRFHLPVLEAVRAVQFTDVELVELRNKGSRFRGMAIDPGLVGLRLERALGRTVTVEPEPVPSLATADVVFADWADKGALWASLLVGPETRMVVRVHSVDVLGPWLHLVDWSRVQDLICVSEHIMQLTRGLLGERLASTRCHVVPHVIDLDRFRRTGVARSPRVLCMVGWAQRVKDPLWTLEVLARLSCDGEDWRLLLVGNDFAPSPTASGRAYAEAFRQRAMAEDLRDRIEYVGYTEDLPPVLGRASFVVSSSIREAWHIGALEAVAAGAVPVIRQWPLFARFHAASMLYPDDWVVDSVEEAVDRIRALSGPTTWQAASRQAQHDLASLSPADQITRSWQAIVLGDQALLAQLTEDGRDSEALAIVERAVGDDRTGTPLLRQALQSATSAGAMSMRLAVLERLFDGAPGAGGLRKMRAALGQLRETSSDWSPTSRVEAAPVDPITDRVLHVLKVSMPHRQSGYSVRSMYLLSAQQQLGLDPVGVTALDFPSSIGIEDAVESENVGGVRHLRLLRDPAPKGEPRDAYLDAWTTSLLSRAVALRPDVIHVHSGHRGFESALVGLAVGRALGRPVVYEMRGFFEALWTGDLTRAEHGETYQRRRAVEERCMRAANAVVTLSESMRADIVSRGIDPARVHVVPNGVDTDRLTPVPRSAGITDRLGLTGRFIFGYVSNLDHRREGQELLIDAAVSLRSRGIPATALIVGEGKRRAELEARVRELDAGDVVVFTGQVRHEEVSGYYAQCDVFVVPRIDERAARLVTPLKPFEAMALEIPVVVSDLPALLEIIGDGDRGVSFETGSADSLVEVLAGLAADPARRARLARRGREWVVAERTWLRNAARYRAVYESVKGQTPQWPDTITVEQGPERADLELELTRLGTLVQQAAGGGSVRAVTPAADLIGLRWQIRALRRRLTQLRG